MKEPRFPRSYDPTKSLEDLRRIPVWKNPESDLFVEWYLHEIMKTPEERSSAFQDFLQEVQEGTASLPTDEQIARYKVRALRDTSKEE